ncbi:MAG TPA: L,D-transpeptidase family protein [Thermomicrobiales bacterium]|nr:L,D-transpeptidase family protein [Thermomicrobiales bacterium]
MNDAVIVHLSREAEAIAVWLIAQVTEEKIVDVLHRRPSGLQKHRIRARVFSLIALLALVTMVFGPVAASAQTIDSTAPTATTVQNWTAPRTVFIPQTGQTIDGVFLDFWRANSGIANYGFPVAPEFTMTNGVVAQFYSYARFEYWPNATDGQTVKLGNIGEELRPLNLARNSVASTGSTDVNQEMAQVNRAWSPLNETEAKAAAKKNSPTFIYVAATQHTVSNGFKTWWDTTGNDAYLGNPLTQEYQLNGTTYQVFERGQLAWNKVNGVWLVPVGTLLAQKYQLNTAPVAQGNIPTYAENLFVAPKSNGGERWIEVNLTTQYLIAWEGNVAVNQTYVSTGRPGFDTPPGTYHVLTKLESQTMEGVIGGEYYNVPNVPWVQYFTNYGHALHGTYWHNNFGNTMSHGCVNLPMDFAEWLYGWTSIGTRVEIHY